MVPIDVEIIFPGFRRIPAASISLRRYNPEEAIPRSWEIRISSIDIVRRILLFDWWRSMHPTSPTVLKLLPN